MKKGKVYLAGAGPGDPGLITVKTLELIKTTDVILYDSLINPVCLINKKDGAKALLCGKRYGRESFAQEETNGLMVKYAKEGKMVLRLKGGDPWLFSRGVEEAEYLVEHGISFEIVPGVTSPLAAAAYAGIPVSHRDWSSNIAISTGRLKEGRSLDELNIPNTETVIYLMAVENLEKIVEKLLASGRSKDEPAALIQNATQGRQKTVVSTLDKICSEAKSNNIEPPAIFVTGEAIKIREKLKWYERLPLFGKRLIVTRPSHQACDSIMRLASLGAEVIHYPTLFIKETKEAGKLFDQSDPFTKYTDIIFTSENCVNIFFRLMNSAGFDSRDLFGTSIHAIGPTTADTLLSKGIVAETVPEIHTSQGLLDSLGDDLTGRNFLLPRAEQGSHILMDGLVERGAEVKRIDFYKIAKPDLPPLDDGDIDGILFTSRMGVKNFMEMNKWPKDAVAFCIGDNAASPLEGTGMKTVVAKSATIESLIASVLDYYRD